MIDHSNTIISAPHTNYVVNEAIFSATEIITGKTSMMAVAADPIISICNTLIDGTSASIRGFNIIVSATKVLNSTTETNICGEHQIPLNQ